jgi:hypothetical protein
MAIPAATALKSVPPSPAEHASIGQFSVEVDAPQGNAWDRTLAEFCDGHYEQTACAADRQGEAKASHLLLRQGGLVVAAAQVAIYVLPGLKGGLALVRFGPFWRRREHTPRIELYRAVIAALVEEYCERRGHCLVIRPRPHPDVYATECDVLTDFGFVVRRPLPASDRYLVDASLDEEAQRKSLDQKWRYNLRQAESKHLDIRFGDTDADVAAFRQLHDKMTDRKRLDSAARGMIDHLDALTALPPPIRMRVVLARHEGQAVAGATVGIVGDMAFYVLGATSDAALELKAGYALQWWIVRWLSAQNVRWYELGGTGDPGIRQFKKGLIGKRGTILHMAGEYERWTRFSARLSADIIYGLRDIRNFVSRWAH